ncbi:T9SS type A sorting domain-containing protein [Winogradskyella luteola]|uniref:T9SS type A sorting domain-containing protein n=1 Tax=Winogradskyella luteola TaxID=2828330 RepID=A0A9X1F6E8_9FLAO|nr:T9SS type A sorting domain-containing protein [Winogradskyella luteola]MBV7268247.1 T9SS type A sorting domain-containing protein [Winogradskyella luteola]
MKKITLLITCFLFVYITNAQVVFQDDFSDLTINQPLNGQSGWSNDTSMGGTGSSIGGGPLSPIVGFPLSYTDYGSSPNSLFADNTQETDGVGHIFDSAVTSGTFYVSFVINVSSAPSSTGTVRDVIRVMSGSSFSTTLRLWVEQSGGTGFNFGIKTGDPSNNGATTASEYDYDTDHLVVLKYTINPNSDDDQLDLFVDPDYINGEPGTATLSAPLPMFEASTSVDRMAFPWNATPSNRFGGHIGLPSVAVNWESLNLSINDFREPSITMNYLTSTKNLSFGSTINGELNVYSIDGKRILNTNMVDTNSIDLSSLKTGLYFAKTVLQSGQTETLKFIVK